MVALAQIARQALSGGDGLTALASKYVPPAPATQSSLPAPPTISSFMGLPPSPFNSAVFGPFNFDIPQVVWDELAPLARLVEQAFSLPPSSIGSDDLPHYARALNILPYYEGNAYTHPAELFRSALSQPDLLLSFDRSPEQVAAFSLAPLVRNQVLGQFPFPSGPIRDAEGLGRLASRLVGYFDPGMISSSSNVSGMLMATNRPASFVDYGWNNLSSFDKAGIEGIFGKPQIDQIVQSPELLGGRGTPVALSLNPHLARSKERIVRTLAHELSHAIDQVGLPQNWMQSLPTPVLQEIVLGALTAPRWADTLPAMFKPDKKAPVAVDRALVDEVINFVRTGRSNFPDYVKRALATPEELIADALARHLFTRDMPVLEKVLQTALRSPAMQLRFLPAGGGGK